MKLKFSLSVILIAACLTILPDRDARAASCGGCCNCQTVRNFIVDEIKNHEKFLVDNFWKKHFDPALTVMAQVINNALTLQTTQMAGFMEGQDHLEKQRVLQELSSETARSYLPSEQLCRFASLGESLSSSEEKARANSLTMMQRSLSRQLGTPNTPSAEGGSTDMANRAARRASGTCNKAANGGQDAAACVNTNSRTIDSEIDFTKTFDSKPTLDVDFTEAKSASTEDEQSIVGLADNLFASDLFQRPDPGTLKGTGAVDDARMAVMDMRSIIAKRSVAENSFNTLVSLKSRGSGIQGTTPQGSTKFIAGLLKELKLDDPSALSYLGKAPSYDAQMEVLTKKIYQSPSFYINLMDNPANVDRQYAAMQSFGLMQQRDIFDSILRSEMLLSMIVEVEVAKYQDEVQALSDR